MQWVRSKAVEQLFKHVLYLHHHKSLNDLTAPLSGGLLLPLASKVSFQPEMLKGSEWQAAWCWFVVRHYYAEWREKCLPPVSHFWAVTVTLSTKLELRAAAKFIIFTFIIFVISFLLDLKKGSQWDFGLCLFIWVWQADPCALTLEQLYTNKQVLNNIQSAWLLHVENNIFWCFASQVLLSLFCLLVWRKGVFPLQLTHW